LIQAVVDAVAALLSAGAFSQEQAVINAAGGSNPPIGSGQSAWALDFLATHLGDGRATAAPNTVMQVHFVPLTARHPSAGSASHVHVSGV
jgi:hypothetical protein